MSKKEILKKNTDVLKAHFGGKSVKRSVVYKTASDYGMTDREGKNVVYKSMVPAEKRGFQMLKKML